MKSILCFALGTLLLTPPTDDALLKQAKSALDATGFHYETAPSGKSYTLLFNHPGNRKQTVYMTAMPNRVAGLVTYNFYTTVWTGKNPPELALMQKVLGSTRKIGTFYVFKGTNNVWVIRFQSKFDATDMSESPTKDEAAVKAMKDTIYFVNAVGEETDRDLNGDVDIER